MKGVNKTTNIIFDELSTLRLPSGSLQTALDKVAAALGSVGDAGQQARQVVDELRASLQAAAVQGVKSARSLAKFDEINRLSAPAAEKTAASAKEKQAAQAAAKAAKSTAGTTAGSTRRSGKAGTDAAEFSAVWQQVLAQLRGIWADFWAYLEGFFAPFVTAWQTVWAGLGAAVSSVWEPLWAELSTVVTPAVELLDTVWQGLWQGVQNAWAVYGQPILEGLAQGWQNVVSILSTLWGGVVQPVFLQLFDLLAALWSAHLQPLWNELTACLGAVAALLLTVWNTILGPLVQWLIATLAPVAVQVYHGGWALAVTGAAGIIADAITLALAGAARPGRLFGPLCCVGRVGGCCLERHGRDCLDRVGDASSPSCRRRSSTVLGVVRRHRSAPLRRPSMGCCRAIGRAKSMAGSVLSGAGQLLTAQAALPGLGYAASMPIPALAQGAVIPPNRRFPRHAGRPGPAARTSKRRCPPSSRLWRETLAGWQGGDGQPITHLYWRGAAGQRHCQQPEPPLPCAAVGR